MIDLDANLLKRQLEIKKIEQKLEGHPVLLPIPRGFKHPYGLNGWEKTTYAQTQSSDWQHQLYRAECTGVLLGIAGDNIIVLDVDDDDEVEPLLRAMPFLEGTFQTRGNRGRGFWLRTQEGRSCRDEVWTYTTTRQLKEDSKKHVAELRMGGGAQSVIAGPHKDTGQPYQWLNDNPLLFFGPELFRLPAHWIRTGERKSQEQENHSELQACLADRIRALCEEFFPDGREYKGQWMIGDESGVAGQSLRINLSRKKAGLWFEFNGHEGHGFLELLARKMNTSRSEVFARIREKYPHYFGECVHSEIAENAEIAKIEWEDLGTISANSANSQYAHSQKAIFPEDSILVHLFDFAVTQIEGADCFIVGSALPMTASFLGRRVYLPWGNKKLYCNLFSMLAGKPGDRKSSTIDIPETNCAKDITKRSFPRQIRQPGNSF